jgi:hypothetical protein
MAHLSTYSSVYQAKVCENQLNPRFYTPAATKYMLSITEFMQKDRNSTIFTALFYLPQLPYRWLNLPNSDSFP